MFGVECIEIWGVVQKGENAERTECGPKDDEIESGEKIQT